MPKRDQLPSGESSTSAATHSEEETLSAKGIGRFILGIIVKPRSLPLSTGIVLILAVIGIIAAILILPLEGIPITAGGLKIGSTYDAQLAHELETDQADHQELLKALRKHIEVSNQPEVGSIIIQHPPDGARLITDQCEFSWVDTTGASNRVFTIELHNLDVPNTSSICLKPNDLQKHIDGSRVQYTATLPFPPIPYSNYIWRILPGDDVIKGDNCYAPDTSQEPS